MLKFTKDFPDQNLIITSLSKLDTFPENQQIVHPGKKTVAAHLREGLQTFYLVAKKPTPT